MKLKGKFFLPVCITTILIGTAGVFLTHLFLASLIQRQVEGNRGTIIKEFEYSASNKISQIDSSIEQLGQDALSHAALFSGNSKVLDNYKLALLGNINDEADAKVQSARQQMRYDLKPLLDSYAKNTGIKDFQVHFHLANVRSFVRMWRDGWQTLRDGKKIDISDDLSSFRQTLIEVNRDHKPLHGIEVGKSGFTIRGIVPISDADGEHVGSVEVIYPFSSFLTAIWLNSQNTYVAYMDQKFLPIVTSMQDPEKNPVLGNYVFITSTNKDISTSLVNETILDQGREKPFSQLNDKYYLTSFPVKDYSGNTIGVMVMIQNVAEQLASIDKTAEAGKNQIRKLSWEIGVGILVSLGFIVAVLNFILTKVILTPLGQTVNFSEKMAKGDFSEKFKRIQGNDEISQLGQSLNSMADSLSTVLADVNILSSGLFKSTDTLAEISDKMQIGTQEASAKASSVASSAVQMSANMDTVAAAMEQSSINVENIAAATEEMSANTSGLSQEAENARQGTEEAVDKSTNARQKVNELGEAAKEIGQMTEIISTISDKTNLLALNATIEAARAGEAGKGFAVVANEIKELANQTANATGDIDKKVSIIQKSVGSTVADITDIYGVISRIHNTISIISENMREQKSTTSAIAENINQVSTGIREVNENIAKTSHASSLMATEIEEVNEVVKLMENSSSHVMNFSKELNESATSLQERMKIFKTR